MSESPSAGFPSDNVFRDFAPINEPSFFGSENLNFFENNQAGENQNDSVNDYLYALLELSNDRFGSQKTSTAQVQHEPTEVQRPPIQTSDVNSSTPAWSSSRRAPSSRSTRPTSVIHTAPKISTTPASDLFFKAQLFPSDIPTHLSTTYSNPMGTLNPVLSQSSIENEQSVVTINVGADFGLPPLLNVSTPTTDNLLVNRPSTLKKVYMRSSKILATPTTKTYDEIWKEQEVCLKSYYEEGKLKYECPIEGCGKKTIRRSNLKSHMKTHFEKREFTCDICGFPFSRPYDLKRHKLYLSQANEEPNANEQNLPGPSSSNFPLTSNPTLNLDIPLPLTPNFAPPPEFDDILFLQLLNEFNFDPSEFSANLDLLNNAGDGFDTQGEEIQFSSNSNLNRRYLFRMLANHSTAFTPEPDSSPISEQLELASANTESILRATTPPPSVFKTLLPRIYKTKGGATILVPPSIKANNNSSNIQNSDDIKPDSESVTNDTPSQLAKTLLNQIRDLDVNPPPPSNLNNIPNFITSSASFLLESMFIEACGSRMTDESALEILTKRHVGDLQEREERQNIVDILTDKSLVFMHSVGNNETPFQTQRRLMCMLSGGL
ncbi:hypothetical protein HK098_003235 [Nowakowskiella sp. JEL0407]|nr:hypothetical protein HK098_003235 [Nowakowskiella sp. JEL0407]